MATYLSKSADRSVRIFLAIELPIDVQTTVGELGRELIKHESLLKMVPTDLFHVTIRFLGNQPIDRAPAITEAAQTAALQTAPFYLELDRLSGFYRGLRLPRVIWIGFERDAGYASLQQLFVRLEDELAKRGFDREKRGFSPHVTLARVRDGITQSAASELSNTIQTLQMMARSGEGFEVRRLTVMRSDSTPQGPQYTALARAPLGRVNSFGDRGSISVGPPLSDTSIGDLLPRDEEASQ